LDITKNLIEAVKDTRFLLNRGYNREGCVRFVGDKFQLNKTDRLILYRGVYSEKKAKAHMEKLQPIESILGKSIAVDGYNVLITVESILSEGNLIICDDQFVRDLSAIHGKYEQTDLTKQALKEIIGLMAFYKPKEVIFFYDAQASMSGELASLTRIIMREMKLCGDARTAKQTDLEVLKFGEIVASSDAVLIDKAKKVIDLPREFLKIRDVKEIINLTEI